ncbi:MAG TPA: DUF192 domain-containing protein [Solirubrobacteraceae bacterium]|nr:DUF192 domain-containing protein [Solirubrobacteraceae bacterium]
MLILALTLVAALPAAEPAAAPSCFAPDGTRIRLELALTEQERALGLMFRDTLPADQGMLFVFDQDAVYPFWMKNTIIPLDMVWLDGQGGVVFVRANVPPCRSDPCPSFSPTKPARAVLELNAGFAAKHQIAPGASLRFENVAKFPVRGVGK